MKLREAVDKRGRKLISIQLAGFQNGHEYVQFQTAMLGRSQNQEVWPESGFVRSLPEQKWQLHVL